MQLTIWVKLHLVWLLLWIYTTFFKFSKCLIACWRKFPKTSEVYFVILFYWSYQLIRISNLSYLPKLKFSDLRWKKRRVVNFVKFLDHKNCITNLHGSLYFQLLCLDISSYWTLISATHVWWFVYFRTMMNAFLGLIMFINGTFTNNNYIVEVFKWCDNGECIFTKNEYD